MRWSDFMDGEGRFRVSRLRRLSTVLLLLAATACSTGTGDKPGEVSGDVATELPPVDQSAQELLDIPDTFDTFSSDSPELDAFAIDDKPEGLSPPDAVETESDTQAPVCLLPPPKGEYTGTDPAVYFEEQGVTELEMAAFETMSDALLADQSIYFVTTYLADEEAYLIKSQVGTIKFTRHFTAEGPQFEVVEQTGTDPFSCRDASGYNNYEDELKAGENPLGTDYTDLGYEPDDPRVGFIEPGDHCFPSPLLRLAQLYDSPNAPDFHYGMTPFGVGSGGSHGALDVLQARVPLVISGTGIKNGIDESAEPMQVDIAPTALYMMGALPSEGRKHGVDHSATWLKWQDGNPISHVLEDGCVQPYPYVFIFLFDGLASNELVHLFEEEGNVLPAFNEIMSNGTVFRNGALAGFPTVSVPGHLSVGTGMFQGHHFFINNGFYYRSEDRLLSPGDIIAQAQEYAANPQQALDLFDFIFNPEGETLFEAAHRHFGDAVYAASVNELTLRGADYTIVDLAGMVDIREDYFELADMMSMPQLLAIIDEHAASKSILAFTSLYQTDHIGEAYGPHSDQLRAKLIELDAYLQKFLDRLDTVGIRDQSLIVLTADHGMELQDKNRTGNWGAALQSAGYEYLDPDGFGCVYLK